MDKGNMKKDLAPFIILAKLLNSLKGSAATIAKPTAYHGTSSMAGRKKDAALRRSIAKRKRRKAHLKSMRG